MTRSTPLERMLAVRGATVVLGTLAALGVATTGLLHVRERAALDEALVVAVRGGLGGGDWALEHGPSLEASVVEVGTPGVPRELAEEVLRTEQPVFFDQDGRRVVLVVAERGHGEGPAGEEHRLVRASVEANGAWVGAGQFLAVYLPLSALAAAVATALFRAQARQALAPLARASREVAGIEQLESRSRLTEEGPAEVLALVRALNALLDRLAEAHQAQSRFTAEAAHELWTPITTLLLALDLELRRPPTVEGSREALVSVREEVLRLRRMAQGLLALARLEGESLQDPEVRAVRALVMEALSVEAAQAELEVGEERVVIRPDLTLVALRNLIRNAVRHAPGARMVIRTRQEGERVRIEVEDEGPGIPEEERERMFDPLVRAGESRRRDPEGLGLGLAMTRKVARLEGGDCVLESGAAGGCRAVLILRSR